MATTARCLTFLLDKADDNNFASRDTALQLRPLVRATGEDHDERLASVQRNVEAEGDLWD